MRTHDLPDTQRLTTGPTLPVCSDRVLADFLETSADYLGLTGADAALRPCCHRAS